VIWSPLIISELNRLLTWFWLERHGGDFSDRAWRQYSEEAKRLLARLTAVFHVFEDRPPAPSLWDQPSDVWDVPIWTAAKRAQADFVVTANLSDGPPADTDGNREYEGIAFIHPDEFLGFLNSLADYVEMENLAELPLGAKPIDLRPAPLEELAPSVRSFLADLIARKFGETTG